MKTLNVLKKLIKKPQSENGYIHILKKITEDSNGLIIQSNHKRVKILYGPSFSIYTPCFIHDSIMSNALRLRGAEIIPIYCDRIQKVECNVYGGVWGGGKNFSDNCKNCFMQSTLLWKNSAYNPIRLSEFIVDGDRDNIDSETKEIPHDHWDDYEKEGMPIGHWAKDILINNYVVGDYHLIPNHNFLGISHIQNLILLSKLYRRIIDFHHPERIITNDSYYGMWAILEFLAKEKGIPFYSHWNGTRIGAWCYAYNDAAMNLDFKISWPKFSKKTLTKRQHKKVTAWLSDRIRGKDMVLDTASIQKYKTKEFDWNNFSKKKPTALLLANVIWDLAALNKQIMFDGMIDWILCTIKWFVSHPEYQLIIKPHPAEIHPAIPKTRETVSEAIKKEGIILPSNVFLLPSAINLTSYELFGVSKLGIVYTSTSGVEMAARDLPVITAGKAPYRNMGFTIDPVTRKAYFDDIKKVLSNPYYQNESEQKQLAYKYILFNFYHYYTSIDFMTNVYDQKPQLKIKSVNDILPGKNKYLDYIVNSIMRGLPIMSANRWPPES